MEIKLQSISASKRWLTCTKSLLYNKLFNESEASLKGNLVHDVSELRLREIFFKEDHQSEIRELINNDYKSEKNPNLKVSWDKGCEISYENYIRYAIKMYNKYLPHTIEIEKKVNLKWYGYKKFGYIDLVMKSDTHTIVIDLKSGRGRVETKNNYQMLMYAIAEMQDSYEQNETPNEKIVISICQALINNIGEEEYKLEDLATFYKSFEDVMKEIKDGNLVYRPSQEACIFCDYKKKCDAKIKEGVI